MADVAVEVGQGLSGQDQAGQLLQEEGVPTRALDQRVDGGLREVGPDLQQETPGRGRSEWTEAQHRASVPAADQLRSVDRLGREEDEQRPPGQLTEEVIDQEPDRLGRPVHVGQDQGDRPLGQLMVEDVGDGQCHLGPVAVAVTAPELGLMAEGVAQGHHPPVDLRIAGPETLVQRRAELGLRDLGTVVDIEVVEPAEQLTDGPPHVGLAVGQATSVENSGPERGRHET